jgi:hypothetical protein
MASCLSLKKQFCMMNGLLFDEGGEERKDIAVILYL